LNDANEKVAMESSGKGNSIKQSEQRKMIKGF